MRHKKYDFRTAYIDLLLNVLTTILFITAIAFSLIALKKANEDIGLKSNAQFIVTAEWDKNLDCDVDLWTKDPDGNISWFNNKSVGIMHLDRDDLGVRSDTVYNTEGIPTASAIENKEIWTLRGKQYGEFVFNVHLYSCQSSKTIGQEENVKVIVEIIRVNPVISSLRKKEILLKRIWDEETAFIVEMSENGWQFKEGEQNLISVENGVIGVNRE